MTLAVALASLTSSNIEGRTAPGSGFARVDDFGYVRSFSITSDGDFASIAVSMYRALTVLYGGEEELQNIATFDGLKPPPLEDIAQVLAEIGLS